MSHKKLRTEKNCLNCGHEVETRFCSNCGQENLEMEDTAFHLAIHYIQDLFHYDGKLWHTFKSLVTRPGLVACEYMEGKRNRHLEPIRYYVFASSVFFLTFFVVWANQDDESPIDQAKNYDRRLFRLEQEKKFLEGSPDTVYANQLISSLRLQSGDTNSNQAITSIQINSGDTSSILLDSVTNSVLSDSLDHVVETESSNLDDLSTDSIGWLGRVLMDRVEKKAEELEQKHEGDDSQVALDVLDEILHTLPQLIFLSLPFFALFLKVLYWRSRKGRYVEHFIFSVYNYAYLFTIFLFYILVILLMGKLEETPAESIIGWVSTIMVLYPFIYLFLSMKRFYNDRLGKLIIRYMILMTMLMFTIFMLFLLLAVIAFLF